ncbi:MAG: sulfite exporter TauE/SafE family protein [Clostridium sp.]|nr:sulfite exporter TauE/SafE family protein [Clostridium sp.]
MGLDIVLIVFVVCFIGSILQGMIGIGFAVVIMSLLPLWIPFKIVASIELILGTVTTISLLYPIRKHAKLKYIIVPTLSMVVFTKLGVDFLMKYDVNAMSHYLGILLILFSITMTFISGKTRIKPSVKNGIIAGSISGFLGGAFSISGPPMAMYYFSLFDDVKEYEASMQLTFLLSGIYKIVLFFYYGNMNSFTVRYSLIGFLAVILGSFISFKLIKNIDKVKLKHGIAIFMAVMGLMLILKGVK